jgi:hypothetical protein
MNTNQPETSTVRLQWYEHLCCGLPLVLLLLGGAIGGACGGLGYGLSAAVFKKTLPTPVKYLLSLAISAGAFVLYLGVVIALTQAFPNLFKH